MARLQILELPAGPDDARPPFVLVVDETAPQRIVLGADTPWRDYWQDLADKIGARGVIVMPDTVEIPANDTTASLDGDDAERAGTTQIVYAHERTRLDLCSALLVSGDTTWRKLIEHVAERQRELAGLYRERDALATRLQQVQTAPTKPDVMNAQQERRDIWLHGYECGAVATKAAARPRNEETTKP
jgi:hypothetical protein